MRRQAGEEAPVDQGKTGADQRHGTGGYGRVPDVAVPAVPVPGGPGFGQLTCTYYPAVAGYNPVGVSFRRY